MERKSTDITVISVWVNVVFTCPHCEEEVEIDYDVFVEEQGSRYPGDWSTVKCPECGEEVHIARRDFD